MADEPAAQSPAPSTCPKALSVVAAYLASPLGSATPLETQRLLLGIDWRTYGVPDGVPTFRQVDQVRHFLADARLQDARATLDTLRQVRREARPVSTVGRFLMS